MFDLVSILKDMGPVSLTIMVVLLLMSIGSWKVIIQKSFQIRRAKRHSDTFLGLFRNSNKFMEVKGRLQGPYLQSGSRTVPGRFQRTQLPVEVPEPR